MIRKVSVVIFIVFFYVSGFSQAILFVGNSLTYTNELPKILEEIGTVYNISIQTECLCSPNYAIIDHLNEGKLQRLLKEQKFDFLIVQQGPSSQAEGAKMLLEDGESIKQLADKYHIKMGCFMVWTSVTWYHTMDEVIKNHQTAAQKNNALLFRVGEVWKAYLKLDSRENLYAKDGFHPSPSGSFLAALTIFHQLFPKQNLSALPASMYTKWLENESAYVLLVNTLTKVLN